MNIPFQFRFEIQIHNTVQWYWTLGDVNFFCISFRFSCRMLMAIRVFVTLRLPYSIISLERCIVIYLWVNLIFNGIIHLMVWYGVPLSIFKDFLIANEIFHMAYWHFKVSQPLQCFQVNLVLVSSPLWISMIGSRASSVEKLVLGLTPENLWKLCIFRGDSGSPHRGTEIGCYDNSYIWTLITKPLFTSYSYSTFS